MSIPITVNMGTPMGKLKITNRINYSEIKQKSIIRILNDKEFFINVIIPVRDRDDFVAPCVSHLLKSAENCNQDICITLVEESDQPKYKDLFLDSINYIHIHSSNKLMNKCLAHNCAFNFSNKSKFYIFHDVDVLVQSDFFTKVIENSKGAKAMQTFSDRRLNNLNKELTSLILEGKLDVNTLTKETKGVELPKAGAPGGSILIERNLFISIGGYDPEFFWGYAPEDLFFWNKIETISEVKFPQETINLFHMNHKIKTFENPLLWHMHKFVDYYNNMSQDHKKAFLNEKSNLLLK